MGRATATAPTRTEARALAATERGRTVRDFWVSLLPKKNADGEGVIGQSRIVREARSVGAAGPCSDRRSMRARAAAEGREDPEARAPASRAAARAEHAHR